MIVTTLARKKRCNAIDECQPFLTLLISCFGPALIFNELQRPTTTVHKIQAAVSLVNDSLLTTVCLQYRPYDVAAAVVYLAHLLVNLPRVDVASLNADESVIAGELGPRVEYQT